MSLRAPLCESTGLLKRTALSLNSTSASPAERQQTYFKTEILKTEHHSAGHITFIPSTPSLEQVTVQVTSSQTNDSLDRCAAHLQAGELVAFPTETVYGLGANALDPSAIRKIYAAKRRPADNPLIVHVSDLEMLRKLVPSLRGGNSEDTSADRTRGEGEAVEQDTTRTVYDVLIRRFWPGALTLLFSLSDTTSNDSRLGTTTPWKVPQEVTCGQPTLAIRMPSHPLARALIARTGLPLAAPSANASGKPSPTTALHVMRDLGGQSDGQGDRGRIRYILDGGAADVGVESTVVDGISAPGELRVLRPGGVTVEQLADCLRENGLLLSGEETGAGRPGGKEGVRLRVYGKDMARSSTLETNPTTPGMKYRHHSPTAPVLLAVGTRQSGTESTTSSSTRLPFSAPPLDPSRPAIGLAELIRKRAAARKDDSSTFTVGLMSLVDPGLFDDLLSDDEGEVRRWLTSGKDADPLGPAFTLSSDDDKTTAQEHSSQNIRIQPFSLGTKDDLQTAAQRLFEGLRVLDEGAGIKEVGGCDLIVVEALADDGIGLAVMNRLAKAASESVLVRVVQS
ncbi:hypothetical protein CF327_g5168 [Tilletia walkeri]|nr:hypothetical protein CF327_g5168 [Tilletia walkeri]